MSDFLCPDCGWQGREDKPLPSIPCPICGQQAMSLELPEEPGEGEGADRTALSLDELEDIEEGEEDN